MAAVSAAGQSERRIISLIQFSVVTAAEKAIGCVRNV